MLTCWSPAAVPGHRPVSLRSVAHRADETFAAYVDRHAIRRLEADVIAGDLEQFMNEGGWLPIVGDEERPPTGTREGDVE